MNAYTILIVSLTLFYGGLILFYHFGWINLKRWIVLKTTPATRVTIIIPARNEEQHIDYCLKDIIAQDYPAHLLEVLVVDDFSTDETAAVVNDIKAENLRLILLKDMIGEEERQNSFKKRAIEISIGQAKGDLIITTDADCRVGRQWVSSIVSFYEDTGHRFIVSPVTFIEEENTPEKMQTLDFLGLQGISGGALSFGFPTMCNGANLAYEKKVFEAVNGFRGVDGVASGDDMMLMQKVNKQYPGTVGYLKSHEAMVATYPQRSMGSFVQQRLRWISKSAHYPDKRITVVLALAYLFNLLLLVNGVLSFFNTQFLGLFLVQVGVKLLVEFLFLLSVTRFFRRQRLLILFLPAQLLHIVYVVVIGLLGNFMTYNWKGRKIR